MSVHSALEPAGAQAARIYGHLLLFSYVMLAVYILVGGTFVYLLIRSWRLRETSIAEPIQPVEHRLAKFVAVASAVTTVILILLLISAAITGHDMAAYGEKPNMQINIIGHQWWWEVQYQNDDPSMTLTTANEIHIPTGRKVLLSLTSSDAIHSFWVPSLNGKRDLIPSHRNTLTIEADHPGVYRGQCAEFCGLQHAHMVFYVIAEPPWKFSVWLHHQLQPAPAPANAELAHGRDVFLQAPCITCHSIRGTTALGNVGPDLTHIASRQTLGAGTLPNTPGHLSGWITDPQRTKPGILMPTIPIAPNDVQPLLAYLESLQ